ncbi:MAG: bifunctional folylpolyglutamate synthase/dihydrofolate synthase, partial [Gammaproteobacteria bacterium]|nr:bifunctional folylpolyglutamate synthase/dihydrofolate synthase [Gammaproteobacteria bacterium]
MPATLTEWVEYIQTLHHREIDMSLERVREVYRRMYPGGVDFRIINIAGTNGKGSTAELIASIYCNAGLKVGKFTSPHISRFNERYNLNREDVDDDSLLAAFVRVEQAREVTRLTFFEFGTLLAIELFSRAGVDMGVMEVGLGGRLDAVNILDPDLAVVTSISFDHMAWLGNSLEQIGREKIAIARPRKPCVIGMPHPPESMLQY